MSFDNKNTNNRPPSKNRAPGNISSNYYNNRESFFNKKKKASTSEDLKRELAEAESFLEKANKEFINFKTKEINRENNAYSHINDAAIKFIEKTLEEKNNIKKKSNLKIPLQEILKENFFPNNSQIENNFTKQQENKNSIATSVAITNNNVENTNFDNNFYMSNPSREISDLKSKDKNENFISKDFFGENSLMSRYKKQLRTNGFPEIGNVYCQNENDQHLLFKFLDSILIKKSNETGDKLKLKKTCEDLKDKLITQQNENLKLDKEFQAVKESLKKHEKDNKFLNEKLSRIKETHDKTSADLKAEINKYKNRLNILQVEKKSFEEKYSKMAENYQKFFSKLNQNNQNVVFHKPANLDISNTVKKNDLIKILSKVNGTEKLIETIKNGYNESLRELLFEISALKNFILEINNEIVEYGVKLDLKGLMPLESNFINMPFLDAIPKIKYALKTNIRKSFDFWNLDCPKGNCYNANKEFDFQDNSNIENNNFNVVNNKDNISSILNGNAQDSLKNINNLVNTKKPESDNFNNKFPVNFNLIRDKNDSIFENEKKENFQIKNNFNNSILKNNNEINSFDQINYDHMIDFDMYNFDLDDSNSNSIKTNKRINFENKDNLAIDRGAGLIYNKFDSNFPSNAIIRKSKDKEESNLIDNELEYLKEKWMKALSG